MMKEIIITFLLLIFTIWVTNCKEMVKKEENVQVNSETTSKLAIHAAKTSLKVSTNSQIIVIIDQFTVFIESSSQMSQILSYYSVFPAFLNVCWSSFGATTYLSHSSRFFLPLKKVFCLIITFVNEKLAKFCIFYCCIDIQLEIPYKKSASEAVF